jgi:hypothetical protein
MSQSRPYEVINVTTLPPLLRYHLHYRIHGSGIRNINRVDGIAISISFKAENGS